MMRRSLSLLGLSLMMGLSATAQEQPKVKVGDHEMKYKSDDLKVKDEKSELKVKADDMKVKDARSERKIKAKVQPMRVSARERVELKQGETQVRAADHLAPLNDQPAVATPAPVLEQVAVPKTTLVAKKAPARKPVAARKAAPKRTAARKTGTAPRTVVRTKVVRDTVFVPSAPQTIVATQTEYLHDTVFVTRVDTVEKVQTVNTYSGYRVPRGDFKKVKLKKEKDGDVWMKRKDRDGIKTEKLEKE